MEQASEELKAPKAGTPSWDGYSYFSSHWNDWDDLDCGAPLPGACGNGGGDEDDGGLRICRTPQRLSVG